MKNKYYKLPALNADYISKQEYFLLFETGLLDKDNFTTYIFTNPKEIIKIRGYSDIEKAFEKIEKYSKEYYLAGYFSYELGYYFENDFFRPKANSSYPLIHLCLFKKTLSFNHKTGRTNVAIPGLFRPGQKNQDYQLKNLKISLTKQQYLRKISLIKEYIRDGETYQVNFTAKYRFNFSGSTFAFYDDLKNRQNVAYGAFCKFKDEYVISLSPELYFKIDSPSICSRPMKGTIQRGKDIEEDKKIQLRLKGSIKDLAENLMIVDLVRNDLGRVSKSGSVKVSELFTVEKYNTLFQLTSTVRSTLRKNITYSDIFKSIFPGGSVTGAPKMRTMQIIRSLESDCRNIYCGALGMIFPGKKAIFNLPIRTISIIKNKGEMGVGSGIVSDSNPHKEFQECLLKARFLTGTYKKFQLIETILWDGTYRFLDEHLRRLNSSARYFDFYYNPAQITSQLKKMDNNFEIGFHYKVRLLLDKDGGLKIDYSKIAQDSYSGEKYVVISRYKIDSGEIFCFHKTTNRDLYDSEYNHYRQKGYYEVIFSNNKNEFTEGAISNIIVEINKRRYTPPVSSGLLPGIFRAHLIKKHGVQERVIMRDDLIRANRIFLCNSVRGLTQVKIKDKDFI